MTDLDASLPAPVAPPRKNSKTVVVLIVLLLVLALAVAGLSFYFFTRLQQHDTQLTYDGDYKRLVEQRLESVERSAQRRAESLQAKQQSLEESLAKIEQQSQYTAQQLLELNASSRADWLLAEAEYLLRLANQRLHIEKDVRGAEAILPTADKVLAEGDDPGLLPVRVALAEEIFALQSMASILNYWDCKFL